MKTFYQDPEMDVIAFAAEDVITTSGDSGGLTNGGIYDGNGDSGDFGDLFPGLKN